MDEKNEIYNLPLASFTFGKEGIQTPVQKGNINAFVLNGQNKNNQNNKNFKASIKKKNLKQLNNIDNNDNNQIQANNFFIENNISQNNTSAKEEICELTFGGHNDLIKEENESMLNKNQNNEKINKDNNYISLFIDNGGMNDSFISVILYSIHYMKLFRKFIINDLNSEKNKNFVNFQNSFLYDLREILLQIGKNKYINIHQFKENLSKQFQNRRKFLLDQPDDPSELLFVIINAIHSNSIQFPLNDVSDENCTEKCFSHKFIWLDLSRIDECKCKGTTKRLFSNHNYITDIPMNKIFDLMNNKFNMHNSIKNNKSKDKFLLYESNQKLFNYYTNLISGIKTNCPTNGNRCPINKTFHKLHLANSPSYLIFNLEHDFNVIDESYSYSVMNILKSLILIPNKFDIWTLFELNSKKNKNDFEFIGLILFKISKVYSCAFKNKKGLLIYYECDNQNINLNLNMNNENNNNAIEFVSYFDFVVFCIKNGLIPIMLFYQGSFLSHKNNDSINTINNFDEFLSNEQISILEKFCFYTDNLYKILQIKIRRKENLISSKNSKKDNTININHNNSINNNILPEEYNCFNCKIKNKIENKICAKCGYNNNDYLKNIKIKNNKKYINNIPKNIFYSQGKLNLNYSNIKKNTQSQDSINNSNKDHMIIQLSKRKKLCVSPDIKRKDNNKILENYNYATYENKNNVNYLDLPMPYIPKKEKQITVISNFNKNNNINYNLNKTEININNQNIIFSNDIKLSRKMHISPKTSKSNNLSINDDHKKLFTIHNRNKIPINKYNNNINKNIESYNKNKKNGNNSTKKIKLITRSLTTNKDMINNQKLYLNSENISNNLKNKKKDGVNQNSNLRKKENNQINRNNLFNYNLKDKIETEINDFNKLKKKNFDLNNLYLNPKISNDKNISINNLNHMNYSYNDIQFDKRKNAKNNINENTVKNIYNKRTFNKNKKGQNLKLNTWICQNCSNINKDDYIYCKVCRRNKEGELKRIKTPVDDKKIKNKTNQNISNKTNQNISNKTNNSFINNLDTRDNYSILRKAGINGFNSTKEFRKNQSLNKNKVYNNIISNQNQDQNSLQKKYNNTRGNIYRTYNII